MIVWIKQLHMLLAYITVAGFVLRAGLALAGASMLRHKFLRIAPHVIDTLLLAAGIALVVMLGYSPLSGWLAAKLLGLLAYIGFGVLTLRAPSMGLRVVGVAGALASVTYIFAVALSRDVTPWSS